ncbi:hypothetical protein PACTADRAFT_51750 [Pachysolen tannophilus NRRL Y-2460]|uniref:Calcineurin-like phosphoesterase domain-containing protein n=1 Tax=Pachysolen tannophilus NRRL Y-2460 TaxID=669874 RepID=A0A1E4TQH3_PACTA|nr:hypothetical protein PACTADRAFT_51750 [Pachysolen tannophilus NRRL Y-2460]
MFKDGDDVGLASETTPILRNNDARLYNDDNNGDDDDDFSLSSERTSRRNKIWIKIIYLLGSLVFIPLAYYLLVYLPRQAPEASKKPLNIVKLGSLPVYLYPAMKQGLEFDMDFDLELELSNDKYQFLDEIVELQEQMVKKKKKFVKRLILIGDIHGSFNQLTNLMQELKINYQDDHIIMLGDFLTKGDDSFGVLNWAVGNNIGCILGNHEVEILKRYAQYHGLKQPQFVTNNTSNEDEKKINDNINENFITKDFFDLDEEMKIAKKLSSHHIDYLTNCPLIYELGRVSHRYKQSETFIDDQPIQGIAVHGGLVWDIENLEDQDPETVISIRALAPPDFTKPVENPKSVKGSESWSKHWNIKQQENLQDGKLPQKVFYGHYAKKGFQPKEFTVGLDSGCAAGNQLTAISIWAEKGKHGKIVYRDKFYQVDC